MPSWPWRAASGSEYKHALEAVAEGLKAELAPFGVKVATVNPGAYVVSPGPIRTPQASRQAADVIARIALTRRR